MPQRDRALLDRLTWSVVLFLCAYPDFDLYRVFHVLSGALQTSST